MVADRIALSSIDQNSLMRQNSKALSLAAMKKSRSFNLANPPISPSKSTLKSKSLNLISSSSINKSSNDADIYASKLKFKLRLALFKLNQQNHRPLQNFKIYGSEYIIKSPSNSSTKLIESGKQLSPSAKLSKYLKTNNLRASKNLTPKQLAFKNSSRKNLSIKKNFENSKNINLTQKSLNSIINKNSNNLKLFSIKKSSSFYNSEKIPLTINDNSNQSFNSFLNPSKPESLPSINKILKTPLKLTTSNNFNATNDDNDHTIDDQSFDDSKKTNSSPLRHFATPNSFSVAKSLLQLGSGVYN